MSKSLGGASTTGAVNSRGRDFEESVEERLRALFHQVERHWRIEGYSGIKWTVDFLVDSDLIVEATVQRRLETKIDSTFIRFTDIVRRNPNLRGALVVEKVHVLLHQSLAKAYFPTSDYRTFLTFGYPIVSFEDLSKLPRFHDMLASAFDISTLPQGFNARSISHDRKMIGSKITDLLKRGPLTGLEISRRTGIPRDIISEAAKLHPGIKKVSIYYGLDEECIFRALLTRGGGGPIQKRLVHRWLRDSFIKVLQQQGSCRTAEFARKIGISRNSLTHMIHELAGEGLVRRVGKGRWALSAPSGQLSLT